MDKQDIIKQMEKLDNEEKKYILIHFIETNKNFRELLNLEIDKLLSENFKIENSKLMSENETLKDQLKQCVNVISSKKKLQKQFQSVLKDFTGNTESFPSAPPFDSPVLPDVTMNSNKPLPVVPQILKAKIGKTGSKYCQYTNTISIDEIKKINPNLFTKKEINVKYPIGSDKKKKIYRYTAANGIVDLCYQDFTKKLKKSQIPDLLHKIQS